MERMETDKHIGNIPGKKKSFEITVNPIPVDSLKKWSMGLPQDFQRSFTKKYGDILNLLNINVDVLALKVLARYWNPSFRCFEFPNLDLTPTIEEYACMTGLSLKKDPLVYFHLPYKTSDVELAKKFGEVLGTPANQIKVCGHVGARGLKLSFMMSYMEQLQIKGDWETLKRVLALTIYGLILFPSTINIVDQAALDVFRAVELGGRNPVPAILAETFLTFNFIQQKGKGTVRCCIHLLYVWIMTHFYAGDRLDQHSHPLRSFSQISPSPRNKEEWKEEFNNAGKEGFNWVCPWFRNKKGDVIFSCGDFPNVPLMGPRGCVTYTPAIVLKQLARTQKKPRAEQLGGWCFWYKNDEITKGRSNKIRNAWGKVFIFGDKELGKFILINSPEYDEWRNTREGGNQFPHPAKDDEGRSQPTLEMLEELEMLKAQQTKLIDQRQKAVIQAEVAHEKNGKMKGHLEDLREVYTDVAQKLKRKTKVVSTAAAVIEDKEDQIHALLIENEELKKRADEQGHWAGKFELERQAKRQSESEKRELHIKMLELKTKLKQKDMLNHELEGSVEHLNALLDHTQIERDRANAMIYEAKTENSRARECLSQSYEILSAWRARAEGLAVDNSIWKRKHNRMMAELEVHVPEFLERFEQADEEIHTNPLQNPSPGVRDFMSMCGDLARELKRRRARFLM